MILQGKCFGGICFEKIILNFSKGKKSSLSLMRLRKVLVKGRTLKPQLDQNSSLQFHESGWESQCPLRRSRGRVGTKVWE